MYLGCTPQPLIHFSHCLSLDLTHVSGDPVRFGHSLGGEPSLPSSEEARFEAVLRRLPQMRPNLELCPHAPWSRPPRDTKLSEIWRGRRGGRAGMRSCWRGWTAGEEGDLMRSELLIGDHGN